MNYDAIIEQMQAERADHLRQATALGNAIDALGGRAVRPTDPSILANKGKVTPIAARRGSWGAVIDALMESGKPFTTDDVLRRVKTKATAISARSMASTAITAAGALRISRGVYRGAA